MSSFEWPSKGSGGGVTTVNTLSGDVILAGGAGITITPSGQTLTIASTSAGDVTLTAVGSTPNANGASLSGQALTLQPANTSFPGVLTAADWNTFNSKQSALTTGNLTSSPTTNLVVTGGVGAVIGSGALLTLTGASLIESTSSVLTISGATNAVLGTGVTIQVKQATTSQSGYLSSTDWTTFNGKAAAGNYITSLTGDVTASGPGAAAASLAATIAGNKTFTGTVASLNFIEGYSSTVTAAGTTVLTALSNYTQVFTGTTTQTITLPVASTLVVGQQFYITNSSTGVLTINSSGGNLVATAPAATTNLLTCVLASGTTAASWGIYQSAYGVIPISFGGTGQTTKSPAFNALSPMTAVGDLIVGSTAGSGVRMAAGTGGQYLRANGPAAALTWQAVNIASETTGVLPLLQGGTGVNAASANAAFNALSPMTTGGDIIYGGASGVGTRLANGTAGQYLKSQGTTLAPAWTSFPTPTTQLLTASSGTYTTPAGVLYITVEMVGGGGGGGGSGTTGQTAGGGGGSTTFGTSLLTASGGGGGSVSGTGGGSTGGSPTVTGPAIDIGSSIGSYGTGQSASGVLSVFLAGGNGGASPFNGAGVGGFGAAGLGAATNSGSGGGGGGTGSLASTQFTGGGGAPGGYVRAQINTPSATYAYANGAAGSAGSAGTSGSVGGVGGSGKIVVREFYT